MMYHKNTPNSIMCYKSILKLNHCGLVTPYGDMIRVTNYFGSDNGLLPGGTKPSPDPMLTYHQWGSVALRHPYRRPILQEVLKISIREGSSVSM